MTKQEINEAEERMKPLVELASKTARHFAATVALVCIAYDGKYATKKEAEKAIAKALDDCQTAFCEALVTGWRMMLAQEIENGIVSPSVIIPTFVEKKGTSK